MKSNYRMGVGIFLLNKDKKLWVGKRIDFKSNFWQMPQGGIDNNESPREAMIRELGEEVGLTKNFDILGETKNWLNYHLPKELKEKVWNGKYVGQKQKWFACNFFGHDKEINLEAHMNSKDSLTTFFF
jgi:putative (di)nucleoside polyphosphate hydrolase